MLITVPELLTGVRALIDADEIAPGQWAPDSMLIMWLNLGVIRLWRKLARAGRVQPVTTVTSFPAAATITIGGDPHFNPGDLNAEPLVIFGVHEVTDHGPRLLRQAQSAFGPIPYAVQTTQAGPAQSWSVAKAPLDAGAGIGRYVISLYPPPASGTYAVTWLERPPTLGLTLSDGATSIEIPAGLENYPILFAARMANTRGGAAPPSIQRMLDEQEAELDFAAEQLLSGNAPRVINKDRELRGWARRGQDGHLAQTWTGTDWWWNA